MRLIAIGSILAMLAAATHAGAATCTVTEMRVLVKDGNFERPLPTTVGHAIPTTVNEADGTFQMDFTGFPRGTFDISGVDNAILMPAVTATGTIDAGGNVALPPVLISFTTALLPGVSLDAMEPLNTGLAAIDLSGKDYVTEGAALDFATGKLRLEGQGVVLNAPVVGTATSGVAISCTLAPVPSADALPTAPSLKARGTSKPGKPVEGTVVGDTVTVKGKITKGEGNFDPTQDIFVRIGMPGANLLLLRVETGTLTQKGKKFSVTDEDGSAIHVVEGRKQEGNAVAALSGSLVIVEGKKSFNVTLKHTGGDLSSLATASSTGITVGIGPTSVSDPVTVKAGTKKTVLK